MRLVVDVGNSRLKWATVADDRLGPGGNVERREPLDVVLDASWLGLASPDAVRVASVAGPTFDTRLEEWVVHHWRCRPDWFRSEPETLGIVNGYTDYTRLGSDRWAAIVGARAWATGAVGVIDCGTATTLDVIDAGDRHLGGWIFPGLSLSQQSLLTHTANIKQVAPEPTAALGRRTADCVANGTLLGLAGVVERWMTVVERDLADVHWIATGGDWPRLSPLVDKPVQHDPDLVLRGLARVPAS